MYCCYCNIISNYFRTIGCLLNSFIVIIIIVDSNEIVNLRAKHQRLKYYNNNSTQCIIVFWKLLWREQTATANELLTIISLWQYNITEITVHEPTRNLYLSQRLLVLFLFGLFFGINLLLTDIFYCMHNLLKLITPICCGYHTHHGFTFLTIYFIFRLLIFIFFSIIPHNFCFQRPKKKKKMN